MDNVSISLPCGFSVKYKNVFYNRNKFKCPACKTHELTVEECLNMTRNRLVLSMKSFELQKKKYEECLKEFEKYKMDPMHFIDLSHDKFKSEIDLRREEIKVLLNKKIDDYYDDLLSKVDIDKYSKLKEYNEKIKDLDSAKKQIDSIKIEQNLDVQSKLDCLKKNKKILENGINLIKSLKNNLNESKFGLTRSFEEIDVKKIFGELYLKEETSFKMNEDDIDELSRSEATIHLKINDFSKLTKQKNFVICSKQCIVKNFEWFISTKLDEDEKEKFGFYLNCRSIDYGDTNKSIGFPIKANAKFSIINRLKPNENLIKSLEYLYYYYNNGYGYPSFIEKKKLIDPINGYYNLENDSIAVEVSIQVELSNKDK